MSATRLDAALSHLRVALAQTAPGDDQIIIDHIRDAVKELEQLRLDLRKLAVRQ